jgi:hypothetical protein
VTTAIEDDGQLMSRAKAMHDLGDLGKARLAQLVADGEIECVHIGRRTLIVAQSVRDYVHRLREANRGQTAEAASN